MNLLTYGSCLSRYVANAYVKLFGGDILGSVYHNRIDRFVDTYVDKTITEINRELVSVLNFVPTWEREARTILENQFLDGTLGKHMLPPEKPGFFAALKREKTDLILLDNFIDLGARQFYPKSGGPGFFLNANSSNNILDYFVSEPDRMDIDFAVQKWLRFIAFLRTQRPEAKLVFVNFPFRHHTDKRMAERTEKFAASFHPSDCAVVPLMDVCPQLRAEGTLSHFKPEQYAMFAGFVQLKMVG